MDKSVFSLVGAIAITLLGGCTTYIENQASLEFEPIYLEATCLLYTSPSPRDGLLSRMPSSA